VVELLDKGVAAHHRLMASYRRIGRPMKTTPMGYLHPSGTRKPFKALMGARANKAIWCSALVRLATRLIVEEGL